ncbi:MAG TPA: hypothetical protein PK140_18285 [Polyangiaceae bacterium]|nr:MAG: hypothetical protein BWY17_01576 [Deltaproteobacteria bacterium ADurb.Bin207]HPB97155.1 hypothetical protein [Polyangiaceae bacterium]HQM11356.1 hypothetical protein [Polyangiaceae bacterium]
MERRTKASRRMRGKVDTSTMAGCAEDYLEVRIVLRTSADSLWNDRFGDHARIHRGNGQGQFGARMRYPSFAAHQTEATWSESCFVSHLWAFFDAILHLPQLFHPPGP